MITLYGRFDGELSSPISFDEITRTTAGFVAVKDGIKYIYRGSILYKEENDPDYAGQFFTTSICQYWQNSCTVNRIDPTEEESVSFFKEISDELALKEKRLRDENPWLAALENAAREAKRLGKSLKMKRDSREFLIIGVEVFDYVGVKNVLCRVRCISEYTEFDTYATDLEGL